MSVSKRDKLKFSEISRRVITNDYLLLGSLEDGWKLIKMDSCDGDYIMSSKESSFKDLRKYVKDHVDIRLSTVLTRVDLGIMIICLIILIINAIFFKNEYVRMAIYGVEYCVLVTSWVILYVNSQNSKKLDNRVEEAREQFRKRFNLLDE